MSEIQAEGLSTATTNPNINNDSKNIAANGGEEGSFRNPQTEERQPGNTRSGNVQTDWNSGHPGGVMIESTKTTAAQDPGSSIQPQNDRGQLKWNMRRTREKDSLRGYTWIGLSNNTNKYINIFKQDPQDPFASDPFVVVKPYAEDIVISQLGPLAILTFYVDDQPWVTNPSPITFTEDTSDQTFSFKGVPSDIILAVPNLYDAPNYDDQSVPPQSANIPYAVDQYGVRWCLLFFDTLSNWNAT